MLNYMEFWFAKFLTDLLIFAAVGMATLAVAVFSLRSSRRD